MEQSNNFYLNCNCNYICMYKVYKKVNKKIIKHFNKLYLNNKNWGDNFENIQK